MHTNCSIKCQLEFRCRTPFGVCSFYSQEQWKWWIPKIPNRETNKIESNVIMDEEIVTFELDKQQSQDLVEDLAQ